MKRAAIVSPLRTAVGAFGGALRPVTADTLGATVISALIERTGIDSAQVDDVVFGNGYPSAEAPAIGRYAAMLAGLPEEVPGYQVDRRCGSGLQAVINAALLVQTGNADVVIAGGAESMSNVEFYTNDMRWGARFGSVTFHDRLVRGREKASPEERFGYISGMIETAENIAKKHGIPREAQDEYALRSHQRAAEAWAKGRFAEEVVPVHVPQRKRDPLIFDHDEGLRANASLADMAKLSPIVKDGTVTAGNASQQNDAASACLVMSEEKAAELGLEPMGYLVGWASAGCAPAFMGLGPVPAVQKLFQKTGLGFKDMDLVELNEAFAAQVLGVLKEWGWNEPDKLNVNGSGISLGHPIAATGVRILTTLLHELRRRDGRYGLETMCIGGGMGLAAVFERA
ncbi:MAG: acetyl-CoA C-acetyltransferase [Candidatus Lambdaproteobacteria bacterium]|nr:acetyl-CoA C-acetyltransferase [Candidatus Lambdaproteobacteria bacterium]